MESPGCNEVYTHSDHSERHVSLFCMNPSMLDCK